MSTTLLSLRTGHVCGRNNVSATFIIKPTNVVVVVVVVIIDKNCYY